jgi:hypothetical protein
MAVKLVALTTVLALSACGKANDIPKLQEEATDLAAAEAVKVAELEHRLNPLVDRGWKLKNDGQEPPHLKDIGAVLGEAGGDIKQIKTTIERVAGGIESATKSETPGPKLVELIDNMRYVFEHDETIATADIETGEAWFARIDAAPVAQPTPPPPATLPPQ